MPQDFRCPNLSGCICQRVRSVTCSLLHVAGLKVSGVGFISQIGSLIQWCVYVTFWECVVSVGVLVKGMRSVLFEFLCPSL